ncbi:LuxR C-terminal-related transcriptional regulator [Dysgonomonas sp. ZJ279]|uniref:LuxR C-terminal-related transcriptional regulator n=1 Tax=Dysgonomonas sp. ZJ279 TaxID=2709796 RepID=UPI0013EC257B|nr:LuxR C-terminal-related transcriptional regulator [Dysgonomonas sp. ZJ279]
MSDREPHNWEKHKPYIELLAQVHNSCVLVAEYGVRYLFLSPNFKEFFGYDSSKLEAPEESGADYLETRIHPDDLLVLGNIQKRLIDFIFGLPLEQRTDYKHIFEFRALNKEQQYIRVISQHQILEIGERKDPLIMLGIVDYSPNQSDFEDVRFRLMNIKTGEVVPFPIVENSPKNITKREIEILKLVNNGMLSKEISDKLSISIHTVNVHRQNILQKMEVANAFEAVNYARKLGLMS